MQTFKKTCATLAAVALTGSTLAAFPSSDVQQISADAVIVSNDFDISYEGWCNMGDMTELTPDEQNPHGGSRSMLVSNRLSPEDGVSSAKGLYLWGGQKYDYKVFVRHESGNTENFKITLDYLLADETTWETAVLDEHAVSSGEWTEIGGSFRTPEGASEFIVKITTDSTCDFSFDDFTVRGNRYTDGTVSAADAGLKLAFGKYFRVGNIFNGMNVRNNALQGLALTNYNSIECENETKPDATLVQNGSTDTNIKVSLNSCASIFDFCAKNGIGVRGHTLVWHSQTPQWFFKEGFNNNGAWVNSSTMDKRMESYIKNMFNAIQTQYPTLDLYAYDVCNECISDDSNRTKNNGGARVPGYNDGKSPWVQVYGSNAFIEKAFTYARQYAPKSCKLYYNDYNEYWDHKRDCIYSTCKSLYDKGVLDGVGMQSHINADRNGFSGTSAYVTAMKKFLSIGCDVQVTELDISVENGKYSYQQQADKYCDVFKAAIDCNTSGQYKGKVTAVCIWGPNDSNSWLKSGSNALLFDGQNKPKPAYEALMKLVPESDWQEYAGGDYTPPAPPELDANGYWLHDTFESGTDGWSERGGAKVEKSSASKYAGSNSLSVSGRSDAWNGGQKSLDSRIFKAGEEYAFSACFTNTTGADAVEFKLTLQYDAGGETQYDKIAQTSANKGEYVQLYNPNYKIPAGASSLTLIVETTEETCDFFVDEIIAAPKGTKIDGPKSTVKTPTKMKGDVDFDGRISVADLVALKGGILGGFTNKNAQSNGDVDNSSETNAEDALNLQKYLLGTITAFPDNTPPEPPKAEMRTISEYTKTIKVTEKEPDDSKKEKSGVQYGTVKSGTYHSTTCNRDKPYNILLPAGYSADKKYPVLYVMHGYWENQDRMIIKGNGTMYTRQIIGNAIASGEAEDMIVVFPYIYSSATQKDCTAMDDANNKAYDNFINDLIKDLMPHIEKTYSVKTGRENTAITGFSMGGRESLLIGMQRADLFGYIGAICPAPGVTGSFKWASEEEAPSLVFITAGSNDTVVYDNPKNYHNNFEKNGVPHIWHYVNGGYHGDNSIHAHIYNFVRAVFKA
jgi:arabinoxylan arabinofuranohydrolase